MLISYLNKTFQQYNFKLEDTHKHTEMSKHTQPYDDTLLYSIKLYAKEEERCAL